MKLTFGRAISLILLAFVLCEAIFAALCPGARSAFRALRTQAGFESYLTLYAITSLSCLIGIALAHLDLYFKRKRDSDQ